MNSWQLKGKQAETDGILFKNLRVVLKFTLFSCFLASCSSLLVCWILPGKQSEKEQTINRLILAPLTPLPSFSRRIGYLRVV